MMPATDNSPGEGPNAVAGIAPHNHNHKHMRVTTNSFNVQLRVWSRLRTNS